MTDSDPPLDCGHPGDCLHRFPVQRIPPTHDYIRPHGAGTADPAPAQQDMAAAGAGDAAGLADDAGSTDDADPTPFVHLHVHSNFSFLDGGSRIEELVARAAELGQPALALTDHDGLYGAVRFAKACAKHGIKPIFGAEVRVESLLDAGAADTAAAPAPGAPDGDPHHIVLLAETREGYANLCRLVSAAHLADPERERPPLVTIESLRAHAGGLICLTGCRHGQVGHLIDAERDLDARAALFRLREIFGPDHLYVELQYFGYHPHQEAYAGQHGAAVYEKVSADGGRLRHRPFSTPACSTGAPAAVVTAATATADSAAPSAAAGVRHSGAAPAAATMMTGAPPSPVTGHPCPPGPWSSPPPPITIASHDAPLRRNCHATLVAFWRTPVAGIAAETADPDRPTRQAVEFRPDLPHGAPQRLNPADYDVGFHRDGRPWRLSCLTYCERLVRLAAACDLPTVLTTNAHYAGENDRSLHLLCRAAGRDQPLSGYPDPVPGVRCLHSRAEIQAFAAPVLELIDDEACADDWGDWGDWAPSDYGSMQKYCNAMSVASDWMPVPPVSGRRALKNRTPLGDHVPLDATDGTASLGPLDASAARRASPLAATWEIAERCNVDLDLGTFHFPQVTIPADETAYSLLAKRCFRGIARKYRPVPPRAVELLEKELRMIQDMGFAHYFLVVHDIVRWARARGIACSGRGSAGNSIVCHALDITASEPIRHNLLFERFLNPNRREMPDIDVDFCSSRRDEVIEHIYKTYQNENVAVVANINTMSPRSAVRIVAEALGFAPTEINALAKNVPHHGDAARIREYLAGGWPELRDSPLQDGARPAAPEGAATTPETDSATADARVHTSSGVALQCAHNVRTIERSPVDPYTRPSPSSAPAPPAGRLTPAPNGTPQGGGCFARLLDFVERLDSFPMHLGTHLGGFVIADKPITYYAPLQWAAKGVVVTQFNKDDVAALGLVKMDILGLRTHSAVSECVHLIRQRTGRRIRPYELPPDDPAAYEIISNGGSIGLFQLESAGQRNLASRLQERDFDDVIAAIALYRPGPLEAEMIGPFIDRRWGLEPVSLPHPAMAEAVADTYGVILYQEQVLRIAQSVAGFDLADADSLRRAMTRDRSREEMAKIGETFVSRAVERGVPVDAAREVFRQLEGFAAYGFNKSHSVCFAVISYATAWLKAHYPAEFLCAVLNNYPMGFYTPRTVLNDARRFGLEVRPLDVNLSGRGFTVEDVEPPDPRAGGAARDTTGWDLPGAGGAPRNGAATHTAGAAGDEAAPQGGPSGRVLYDPFAQAWTAEHAWGLTDAELAELAAEQEGTNPGDALACVSTGNPSFVYTLCAHSEASPEEVCTAASAAPASAVGPAAPAVVPRPGDVFLPRAPRARGGVEPGTCLAPSCGIAPDAGRALRVGFSFLKQMGERSLERIEKERRHGPFTSFEDFYLRTRIDYPVAENLIRVGAFDSLEPDRTELLWRLPLLHDRLEALSGSSGGRRGQLRAFFSPPSRAGLERRWSLEDKVRAELELLALTVSCHPLSLYEEELRRMGVRMSYELPGLGDEVPVTVAGVYERAQNPWMRSGKRTMFLTLEDAYGLYECVCFESKLPQIAPVVARASYFLVRGRLQNNHKRGLAIVAEEVRDLEEVMAGRKDGRRHATREKATAPIADPVELRARQQDDVYGAGGASAKHRPLGAGAGTIPKRTG